MRFNTCFILKEADVAELVQLIKTDGLHCDFCFQVVHIGLAASDCGDACTGEGDLGGRAEHDDHIFTADLFAFIHQVEQMGMIVGQVVDTVSVVPEDSEVTGSGLEVGETTDGFIRIGGAVGVRVLRNTPDTLDGIVVVDPALDQCHIRSFGGHRGR